MDMNQFLEVYMEEADEQIQIMEEKMLLLEQGSCDAETIQSLFRAAHTLKGSSAAMGFDLIKNVTHEMESLLDLIRNNQLDVTLELVELLIDSLDIIKLLKEELSSGSGETVIDGILSRIAYFRIHGSASDSSMEALPEPFKLHPLSLTLDERYRCLEAQEQGKAILEVGIELVQDCQMKAARAAIIHQRIADLTDIVNMSPLMDESAAEQNEVQFQSLQFLLISDLTDHELQKKIASLVEVAEVRIQNMELEEPGGISSAIVPETDGEPASDEIVSPLTTDSALPALVQPVDKKKTRSIRVDVERLEHLMNLVGELLIDQVGIKQAGRMLNLRYRGDEECSKLAGQTDHLGRVIHELQEQVMKIRMLSAEQLFSRMPRIVRDLSKPDLFLKKINLLIQALRRSYPLRYKQPESPNARSRLKRG
ncbi:Hpt domain-containing protein [Paenibacillus sp. P46E]|uniref:Hpt domain-containing protein n=1 Tax=Paenibacillus sp. P46E TaxID=1349436 RepID=UPI00093E8574|nr:hypothetical protein A3849_08435 [Paenibacillus sp. P46E]